MRGWILLFTGAVLACGSMVTVRAQDNADQAPRNSTAVNEDEVRGLLRDFQSPDETVRQKAYDALMAKGMAVLPYLEELQESEDEAVAALAQRLADEIVSQGRMDCRSEWDAVQERMRQLMEAQGRRRRQHGYERILMDIVDTKLIMQMRAAGQARCAYEADDIALRDPAALPQTR